MKDFKNSTRTQSGHVFPSEAGFTGSTGMVKAIKPYTRKVPVKLAEGGSVGNATTQRSHATNELDEVAGGKTPLRPGFKKGGKNWIAGATKNKGALHRALKVPEGKKIPQAKLEKAENSKNPLMRKRAALAETLGALHKAEGGSVSHSDVKQDKKLIKSMVKPSGLKKADGGRVKKLTDLAAKVTNPLREYADAVSPDPFSLPPAERARRSAAAIDRAVKSPSKTTGVNPYNSQPAQAAKWEKNAAARAAAGKNYAVGGYAKGGKSYGRFNSKPVIGKC